MDSNCFENPARDQKNSLKKNFFTRTFLAFSQKYNVNRKPHSLLSARQQFDLNTLFSRISLPVSNTLQQNYRSKKDAQPIHLLEL